MQAMRKTGSLFLVLLLFISAVGQTTDPAKMKTFIDALMKKMTVDEKIGQLNLVVGGEATTGSSVSQDVDNKIRNGNVGGIFSITTPARIRKTQEIAVNSTRLKIPLIFGMDVIHENIF